MGMTYGVILADPPWSYRNFGGGSTSGRRSRVNGAAASHPVATWAAPDAVLFMWATWPRLDLAMRIIPAWGGRAGGRPGG